MKANQLPIILLLLVAITAHLPAQQNEADRKLLAEIRYKAEKGDAQSQFELGAAFYFGNLGLEKDAGEAVKWYRKAAEQNLATAQSNLGLCYTKGEGLTKDDVQAAKWYRKGAEQGLAMAQFNLGVCYEFGEGVARDDSQAVRWYRKAAEQNLAVAQFNLGKCYLNGRGVVKDEAEAVKWCGRAAEQNYGGAQFILGACYANGRGVVKDEAEAVKWYRKAAEQNVALAQYNLGLMYVRGQGLTQDFVEAMVWFRKAADQRYADAEFNIGVIYSEGHGVPQDYGKAGEWYRKAAEQGLADAQNNLGWMYGKGRSVSQDYVEAYKWCDLAASQGCVPAIRNRDYFASLMTSSQVAKAQKLSREFIPMKREEMRPSTSLRDRILSMDEQVQASGTGFLVSEDGFFITSEHVVRNAAQIRLVTSAGLISAKVVKVDAANDLALLKAEGRFAALPVTASRAVKLGGTVATVGFPNIGLQGFAPKLAKGEIASLSGAQDDARYFQISVPVQPGNSGGALVDERGNVVGVVSAKLSARAALSATGALPENVNYAVKSSYLLSFLESVPEVSAKLKEPETKERKFEEVVKSAEQAAVLVLVY